MRIPISLYCVLFKRMTILRWIADWFFFYLENSTDMIEAGLTIPAIRNRYLISELQKCITEKFNRLIWIALRPEIELPITNRISDAMQMSEMELFVSEKFDLINNKLCSLSKQFSTIPMLVLALVFESMLWRIINEVPCVGMHSVKWRILCPLDQSSCKKIKESLSITSETYNFRI